MPDKDFFGESIDLEETLAARDRRAQIIASWLKAQKNTLITLNVLTPGPIKRNPFSEKVFVFGKALINNFLKIKNHHPEKFLHLNERSGEFALWALNVNPHTLKQQLIALENLFPLARLLDIDVLDQNGAPIARQTLQHPPRRCLICEENAKICAKTQRHSLSALQQKMQELWQIQSRAWNLAENATLALIEESQFTPKPALVDKINNGSHHDMDLPLLQKSAQALKSYFLCTALTAIQDKTPPSPALLEKIRPIGKAAESAMQKATQGINTHKGAYFLLALSISALAKQQTANIAQMRKNLRTICAELPQELQQLAQKAPQKNDSAGIKLYRKYNILGIRGEAASAFSTLFDKALPYHQKALPQGEHFAKLKLLLALIAHNNDTTTLKRGGLLGLKWAQNYSQKLLKINNEHELILETLRFDQRACHRQLNFGGSADLFALYLFLQKNQQTPRIRFNALEALITAFLSIRG